MRSKAKKYVWLILDDGKILLEIHDPIVRALAEAGKDLAHHANIQHRNYQDHIADCWVWGTERSLLTEYLKLRRTP
jgi:hypothetical protein